MMGAFVRILKWLFGGLFLFAAILVAMVAYFIYAPEPEAPDLSGALTRGVIEFEGRGRTYVAYVPKELPRDAPLLLILHGSGGDAAKIRIETGYAFDRLADREGFAVAYPEAYEGYWNGCNSTGDYSANALNVDDVGFLSALSRKIAEDIGANEDRVFVAGVSRGGHMAFRLAIEAPSSFRAVAAVAANVPSPENFKCVPDRRGATSVMIMNGIDDPLNPFEGGETTLYGLYKRGKVLSSQESARYFLNLYGLSGSPEVIVEPEGRSSRVSKTRWRNGDGVEIELVAIEGAGHVLPQAYRRAPRILGPTPNDIDGPALIWEFFERQMRE